MEAYIAWYSLYCSLTTLRNPTVSRTVHFYSKKSHFHNTNYCCRRSALVSVMQRQRKTPQSLCVLEPAVFFLLPWKSQLKWLLWEWLPILESLSLSRQNAVLQHGSSATLNTQERASMCVLHRQPPQVYLLVTMQLFLFSSMTQEQAVWSQSSGTFLISDVECKSFCSLSV